MRKPLTQFASLPRIPLISHLQAARYSSLAQYNASDVLAWATEVGRYLFRPKHKYPSFGAMRYQMSDQCSVSLAGDWGTGTEEAAQVANQIASEHALYNIHLGDIYYVGSEAEVRQNFLGAQTDTRYEAVKWPDGTVKSLALLGNHDMYSDGAGYFDVLLAALQQKASYFCIENPHWRIIGLDTGYNSAEMEFGPIKPSCHLEPTQLRWLELLNLKGDTRGLIFLSHHGPWSDFETAYPVPAEQISPFLNRPALWFWAHEHRVAVYGLCATRRTVPFLGRCIGHGGMPVHLKKPNGKLPLLFTDAREYPNSENLTVGYNGFCTLRFNNEKLQIEYRDLQGTLLRLENWTPDTLVSIPRSM